VSFLSPNPYTLPDTPIEPSHHERQGNQSGKCMACGAIDYTTVSAYDGELLRLCVDYTTCCQRYRRDATPMAFALAHRVPA
jgi:hypothetical protein